MRRHSLILLAAATIGLAASQASAADLPRKAPAYVPPPPPPVTWTGCYIGANIGGAFSHASLSGVAGTVSSNGDGFAGGGQIGCDYQFTGGFVVGIRNMFDGTSNKRSGTIGVGPATGAVVNFNNQWFDTLTGRIGYSFQPAWLLYLQGGGAWAHTSTNVTFAGVQIGQTSRTGTGWTIGGGAEWMFAPHWSVFLEGNYMDFGSRSGTVVGTTFCVAPGCGYSAKATETTVLVGVNYRFF
jgi:outer membrane immunogenic protein